MKLTKLHENVYYYTDVLENPKEFLALVEKLDEDPESYHAITKWQKDFSERKRKDLFPNNMDLVTGEAAPIVRQIIEKMQDVVFRVSHAFKEDRGLDISPNISPMLDLCKYELGGRIGPHFDAQDGDKSLLYTIVMYFNDEHEGGEVSFTIMDDNREYPGDDVNDPNIDFWVKPKAGSVLIFPSTHPYIHQSHSVKSGNKYMSTSFIFVEGYDCFNPEHIKKYRLDAARA
jgi:hypothetical protein